MTHSISKTFEFCYGHRVWTQTLDARFSDDLKCACRHLHGHEARVTVHMEADTLNAQGMVTDFRHLEWLKRFLNAHVDHKFLIDGNDPLFPVLFSGAVSEPLAYRNTHVGHTLSPPSHLSATAAFEELYGGVLVVDFPPTSEHLSAWLLQIVRHVMAPLSAENALCVTRLDWWETPKSCSTAF